MSTQLSPISQPAPDENAVPATLFPERYARFGKFQADLQRQALYMEGQRVKMQAKVFQALLLLVSRAGEIVTREEVRKQLWPDAFLANLDANVNTTMNKLRKVLGDSPENPRYVETIPRRGYSFIAALEFSDAPGAQAVEGIKSAIDVTVHAAPPELTDARAPGRWPTFLRMASLLVAGMIVGALLAFVWFFAQEKNHRATESSKTRAYLVAAGFHRGVSLDRVDPA